MRPQRSIAITEAYLAASRARVKANGDIDWLKKNHPRRLMLVSAIHLSTVVVLLGLVWYF